MRWQHREQERKSAATRSKRKREQKRELVAVDITARLTLFQRRDPEHCDSERESAAAIESTISHESQSADVALENGIKGKHYCGRESIDATREKKNRENCCCGRKDKRPAGVGVGATARMVLVKEQLQRQH